MVKADAGYSLKEPHRVNAEWTLDEHRVDLTFVRTNVWSVVKSVFSISWYMPGPLGLLLKSGFDFRVHSKITLNELSSLDLLWVH